MNDLTWWVILAGLIVGWWLASRRSSSPAPPVPPVRPTPASVSARATTARPFSWTGVPAARMVAELSVGICDGLTGEPLDPRQRLWRCARCHTCYHEASRAMLQAENRGCCLSCTATRFEPFSVAAPSGPATLAARVWWVGAAAEPGFYVAVLENKPWRQARKLIFPPAFSAQPGACRFIASLADREVTVRGDLASDGPLGPRIVITDRSMVRAIANPTPDRSR
jgi:hypothetical protein